MTPNSIPLAGLPAILLDLNRASQRLLSDSSESFRVLPLGRPTYAAGPCKRRDNLIVRSFGKISSMVICPHSQIENRTRYDCPQVDSRRRSTVQDLAVSVTLYLSQRRRAMSAANSLTVIAA